MTNHEPIKLLNKLLSLSVENEIVEFKQASKQFDKNELGKYFSALANEANLANLKQAWLVFGVKNDKSIVGTSISDKQLNEYKKEIGDHTAPRCSFGNVCRIEKDGKNIILFEIPPAPQGYPISWKGHRYGRDGESLVPLADTEYEKIKSQIVTPDWSKQIVADASIDDLSKAAIDFARKQYKEKNQNLQNEIENWSDEKFLDKAKITIKGKITNAAILLLGNPESEHFISPATSKITWILKDKDNVEKDYEHFAMPLIFAVERVAAKIRNLKYRYIVSDTLFPTEVDQYDAYTIREALNNCIAHQDYTMGGKINVVESEDGWLMFSNLGEFIPNSVEEVVINDSPEEKYRNKWLADAMVALKMIDTTSSGIKKMYIIQRNKFFPLPDYNLSNSKVRLKIFGKVMNIDYTRKLAEVPDLLLSEIILLDKLAKGLTITDEEASELREKKLIEGRKPNYFIGAKISQATEEKAEYSKNKAFEKEKYFDWILKSIKEHGNMSRKDIDKLLWNVLPAWMSEKQKGNRVKNLLSELRKKGVIVNKGADAKPEWYLA
ncbi:MAG: putative DNA binding domain-containing protein [Bacteroidetes bacterium]|nr:putative DNA binding domain-containing protein [Bacteroidota bacterium]